MLLSRLISLLRLYKWKVITALLLSLGTSFGLLLIPLIARNVLGSAISANEISLSLGVWMLFVGVLLCLTATSFLAFYFMFEVAHRVSASLRSEFVTCLVRLPVEYHRARNSGELINRLVTSTADIEFFIKYTIIITVGIAVLVVGGTVMLFILSWKLTLILTSTVLVFTLALRLLIKEVRRTANESEKASGKLIGHVNDILLGIDLVKAFNAERFHLSVLQEKQQDLLMVLRKGARFVAFLEPVIFVTAVGGVIIILMYGSTLLASGELTTETLFAFVLYAFLLVPQSRTLSLLMLRWQHFASGLRVLDDVVGLPKESDREDAVMLPTTVRGDIELREVSFSYPKQEQVLDKVSFSVSAKDCVGIVGASGAGKTTLFNLLLRFYDVEAGTISVDGVDIRRVTAASLRDAIAIVPQDTLLFDDTILENVRYGRRSATDDDVRAACCAAQADAFITNLQNGYDSVVGERGLKLSGGQRQQIAIARALLKNAPILLMDEPTSSLDSETEQELRNAISTLIKDRTTIVIAHRLATVRNLRRIIVLNKGTVVDDGSHEELLQRCEIYRKLVFTQLIQMDQGLALFNTVDG